MQANFYTVRARFFHPHTTIFSNALIKENYKLHRKNSLSALVATLLRILFFISMIYKSIVGRRGGLMVSALDSGSSAPGSSHWRGQCVLFLGKTLYSHGASLHTGVWMGIGEFNAGGNPAMD